MCSAAIKANYVSSFMYIYSAALILQGSLPPVYGACQEGHLAIVELLVSRGARIDQPADVRLIICVYAKHR